MRDADGKPGQGAQGSVPPAMRLAAMEAALDGAAPAPVPAPAEAASSREALILAALRSISKHGFVNSTITTISAESGLSRGLIGHHFSSKDALLLEAFRYLIRQTDAFHRHVTDQAGDDPFRKLLYSACALFLRRQPHIEVWLHYWSLAQIRPEMRAIQRDLWHRYRRATRGRMRRAAEARGLEIDLHAAGITYTQLIDGLWTGLVMGDSYTPQDCCAILRDWLCALFREAPGDHPFDRIDTAFPAAPQETP